MKSFANKSLFVVSILLMGNLFFSACNKDKTDPETAPVPLLASYTRFDNKGVIYYSQSFQYDNQRRLIKETFHNGLILTFEYSGSTVIEKGKGYQVFDGIAVGQLNNQGLCISLSSGSAYNKKIDYYDNGYQKSTIDESPAGIYTSTFTVSEGNYVTSTYEVKSKTTNSALAKEIDHFKSAIIPSSWRNTFVSENGLTSSASDFSIKTKYQFYTDKLNTFGNENMGTSFYGKGNKNPIKTESINYYNSMDVFESSGVINYTYEYDTKGRITKQLSDNGYYSIFTYID